MAYLFDLYGTLLDLWRRTQLEHAAAAERVTLDAGARIEER